MGAVISAAQVVDSSCTPGSMCTDGKGNFFQCGTVPETVEVCKGDNGKFYECPGQGKMRPATAEEHNAHPEVNLWDSYPGVTKYPPSTPGPNNPYPSSAPTPCEKAKGGVVSAANTSTTGGLQVLGVNPLQGAAYQITPRGGTTPEKIPQKFPPAAQQWKDAGGAVDSNGRPIDSQGGLLAMDSQGYAINQNGNKVDIKGNPLAPGQPGAVQAQGVGSGTTASGYTPAQKWYMAGGKTDENGNPIDINGGPVTFDMNGNAIDQNGNYVTINGNPIYPSGHTTPAGGTGGTQPVQEQSGTGTVKKNGACQEMDSITVQYPKTLPLSTPLVLQAVQDESKQSCAADIKPFGTWAQGVQQWNNPTDINNPDSKCLTACNLRAAERHKQCKELAKKFQFDMKQAGCPGTTCSVPSFTRVCAKKPAKKPAKKTTKKTPTKRASVKRASRPNTYTKRGGLNSITTAADLVRFLKDNNLKPHQFNALPWLKANNERMYGNKGKVNTYKRGGREYGIL